MMARTNWKGTAPYEHILGKETGEKIPFLMEYLRVEKKYEALRFAVDFAYRQLIEHPFTAEPERTGNGKWILHKWAEEENGCLIDNYECSQCGSWFRNNTKFCPSCGERLE